ncbi:Apoptosis facilitator Bcl-2-like protein 14 [Nibea albiflora]|uniref:Apoptosis facilitator Bcl-2-like protein 14 n=1 Tax=Nibea albiflora TaxID=240163 RepID=A0ACB7ETH0_NIBAL|nr:Apoptosis facilitator Bcl-2-like protein 14 [Nibea albiflora]
MVYLFLGKPVLRNKLPLLSVPITDKEEVVEKFDHIAGRLKTIAKEIPFTAQEIPSAPSDIETDSPEVAYDFHVLCSVDVDEVERLIGLLLREAGDKLNDEELENADISAALFGEYSFFKRLITTLLVRMGLMTTAPDALGPQASPKTQIAMTCEVTSRLSAVNTLPMNRMLDHGARFLQEYYSSWVKQQGGYEEAFHSDDDDDDDVQ